jgi:hypothetical protein
MTDGTVHGAAEVASAAGFPVAANEDAYQPSAPSPPHDLSRLTSQADSLPKIWHTASTLDAPTMLHYQLLRGEGD